MTKQALSIQTGFDIGNVRFIQTSHTQTSHIDSYTTTTLTLQKVQSVHHIN